MTEMPFAKAMKDAWAAKTLWEGQESRKGPSARLFFSAVMLGGSSLVQAYWFLVRVPFLPG